MGTTASAEQARPTDAKALALEIGRPGLRLTLAWQLARLLGRLAFLAALAVFAGRLIETATFETAALTVALIGLGVSAVCGFAAERTAAITECSVATEIRHQVETHMADMPAGRLGERLPGRLVAGVQRHPVSLAALAVSHAAARMMLGLGPLISAAAIAVVSWQAALTLLVATPVMVMFFVLLGSAVTSRAAAQERAFGRLAAQFADRIRTLPTILASHGLVRESDKLGARMTAYADSTMRVLSLAFLNAGIIDFFAAMSIAVLAVFLGLGHLRLISLPGFSGLQLWQSLLILVAASEYFAPMRRYAEQYHAKAEGEAAAVELDWFFAAAPASTTRRLPALDGLALPDLPQRGLVAVSGPSGIGKSTLLRMLAGTETAPAPIRPVIGTDGCEWISTAVAVPSGSLGDAVANDFGATDRDKLAAAAASVGLLDDAMLPGGLDAQVGRDGGGLSGGQRLRVGVARALLGRRPVLADEPTAKLDPENAARVRTALKDIAKDRLVIAATHDPELIRLADLDIDLTAAQGRDPRHAG